MTKSGKSSEIIVEEGGKEIINLEFATWLNNDDMLTTWLLGTIDEPKLDIQKFSLEGMEINNGSSPPQYPKNGCTPKIVSNLFEKEKLVP